MMLEALCEMGRCSEEAALEINWLSGRDEQRVSYQFCEQHAAEWWERAGAPTRETVSITPLGPGIAA